VFIIADERAPLAAEPGAILGLWRVRLQWLTVNDEHIGAEEKDQTRAGNITEETPVFLAFRYRRCNRYCTRVLGLSVFRWPKDF
jgi:hypothetical protein